MCAHTQLEKSSGGINYFHVLCMRIADAFRGPENKKTGPVFENTSNRICTRCSSMSWGRIINVGNGCHG